MTALPEVNDPVLLRDEDERTFRSRVEGLEPGVITVARPLDLPVEHDDGPGAGLLVTWPAPRGVAVLPTRLIGTHTERGLALWSLSIVGDTWLEQRRNFVRVPAHGALIIRLPDAEPEEGVVTGGLVDLSEAALRCAVDVAAAELLPEGAEVTAEFRFGDATFAIPARIGPGRDSERPDELVELLVAFEDPDRYGDALRKQIFAQQRRTLRPWG